MAGVDFSRYKRMVQMFWDPEPTNDATQNQPVWCLGCSYRLNGSSPTTAAAGRPAAGTESPKLAPASESSSFQDISKPSLPSIAPVPPANAPDTPPASSTSSFSSSLAYDDAVGPDGGWPSTFLDDFESKIWMTYRSDFEPIPKSTDPRALSALSLSVRIKSQLMDQNGFTSDSGWGCMIRTGQSLLANTILMQRLGRDWRRHGKDIEERRILSMFADDPRAPYSLHNFVRHGAAACGKYPGEWFGPSATARCIQALANEHEPLLRVYSTGDGPDVYEDSFMKIARGDGQTFHPTLILVGTRLGIDKITPVYWDALIATLQLPQSVGIAGGRPASSHYFIGAQGSYLFYLDPHHTRPALPYRQDLQKYTDEDVDSCHTRRLRRLHVREIDPSMLIGFLIRDEQDWTEWRRSVKHVQGKAVISVADRDPCLRVDGTEHRDAVDEVETLSDEDDDDTVLEV